MRDPCDKGGTTLTKTQCMTGFSTTCPLGSKGSPSTLQLNPAVGGTPKHFCFKLLLTRMAILLSIFQEYLLNKHKATTFPQHVLCTYNALSTQLLLWHFFLCLFFLTVHSVLLYTNSWNGKTLSLTMKWQLSQCNRCLWKIGEWLEKTLHNIIAAVQGVFWLNTGICAGQRKKKNRY